MPGEEISSILPDAISVEIKKECVRENLSRERMLEELGYVDDDEIKLQHYRHAPQVEDITKEYIDLNEIYDLGPTNNKTIYSIPNETGIEWHIPGQNFTGPGTHIAERIKNRVLPNNRTDAVTLMHDIDYMLSNSIAESVRADRKASSNADYSLPGILTKVGLAARSALAPESFYGGNAEHGQTLKEFVKNNPIYMNKFKELGLSNTLRDW